MEINFDHIPSNLYIGNFIKGYTYPICDFSKTKKKDYIPFKNEPTCGFRFAPNSTNPMIIDPRGFAFCINNTKLFNLISNTKIINGEIIGEYRWIWKNDSFSIEKESIVKTMDIVDEEKILEDVEFNGDMCKLYKLPSGEYGVYIGRCYSISKYIYRSNNSSTGVFLKDDVKKYYFENNMAIRTFSASTTPEHIFVVFSDNKFTYKTYKKFVSFGDNGFSEIITPENIDQYRCTISCQPYMVSFVYYYVYDVKKYYCTMSKKLSTDIRKLSNDELQDISDKYITTASLKSPVQFVGYQNDKPTRIYISDYERFLNYNSNNYITLEEIVISGKSKQEFRWNILDMQDL